MRQQQLKQRLQAGQPAIGSWLALGSPLGAEWMAHQGFDWLGVEHEHGPIDLTLTASLLRAISTTEVTPFVRLPWTEPQTISQALAAGARGLLFPNIETFEQAVRCTSARQAMSGPAPQRVEHHDHDLLVAVLIETVLGLRNVDAILSVPGIDTCMVGPSELSTALGLEPDVEPTDQRYFAAIEQVYAACQRHGVAPGLRVRTAQRAAQHLDEGWQLIAVASDGELMAQAAADVSSAIRTYVHAAGHARSATR
jgi:4-hydroxy-2-oxoheptanedioate aldolase